jgi:anti-sigma B factor antagonist
MFVKNSSQNGYLVLLIAEQKLTVNISNEFREGLIQLINEGDYKIVLDLSKVSFMDSSALGSVIAAYNHLQEVSKKMNEEASFRICCLTPNVQSLFNLLRIDEIIGVYDNIEDATTKI